MKDQLPLFEGAEPDTSEVRLGGSVAGEHRAYSIGEGAYFLVRAGVKAVTHERKSNGTLVRSHKFELVGARRIDHEGEIADALAPEAFEYLDSLTDDDNDDSASGS